MHTVYWLKESHVLYVSYQGHQTSETLKACLDDMAAHLDQVTHPVMLLINWLEVTSAEPNVLHLQLGHRTYSHPMAARGVLVGFNPLEAMENEVASVKTREAKNTQYFSSVDAAMACLQPMLEADAPTG
jgi:hypothetical protein